MTYLIIGGAGRSGRRILDRLTARNHAVRSASRRTGFDWDDESTWPAHLAGVTAAYVCFSPDLAFPGADETMRRFGARAGQAGVERLVLLSGRGEEGARRSERAIRSSGVPTSVLRCSWFHQNFTEHFLLEHVRRGRLRLPAGDVGEAFVDLDDVADAAAVVLTSTEPDDADHELSGPELLTFTEVAAELSRVTGRRIGFEAVTKAEFIEDATLDGMPAADAAPIADLFAEVLDGRNASTTDGVPDLLGRPASSFRSFAERTAGTEAWS